eukprot:Polyplicarium_translucidae@DN3334_c0_g3_i5.p2
MKFFSCFLLVAAAAKRQNDSTVEKQIYHPAVAMPDLKAVLEQASQGVNLEHFAHKLLAFSERTERRIPTGDCGLGKPLTEMLVARHTNETCSWQCQERFLTNCLEEPTIIVNSDPEVCACAANFLRHNYPVPVVENPSISPGCVVLAGNINTVFNEVKQQGHHHHDGPYVAGGCDQASQATAGGARYCLCEMTLRG